jgi:tellurite resistance protein TehA-like permease
MNSPTQEAKPSFVEDFFPGYFALVMATGIVSLAMHFEGLPGLPELLLWLNVIFYVVLFSLLSAALHCFSGRQEPGGFHF